MGKITILPETTTDPISLMGRRAGVCWGGDVTDAEKNYKRGLDCLQSNHGRVIEFVNIEMVIDGYSARVIREWYTHIGGAPTRLQASTRYIKYDNFDYVVPPKIKADPIQHGRFLYTMSEIQKMLTHMEEDGVPREDLATMLPLAMTTKVVDKRNLRNLIDMSRQRMCNRANWEFRELFKDICNALKNYSDEWKYIIETQMKPKCEYLGYCPEKKGCGRVPNSPDASNSITVASGLTNDQLDYFNLLLQRGAIASYVPEEGGPVKFYGVTPPTTDTTPINPSVHVLADNAKKDEVSD